MKFENYMMLEFPSKSTNEGFARSAVACFAAQMDPTLEELGDIKTAVSEAVTNSIVHAYPNGLGIITIRCRVLKDNTLDIVIKDKGVGIQDLDKAMQPMYTTGGADRSGMGFTIMENFMDEMNVESIVGLGTKVTMKKIIKKDEVEDEVITEVLSKINGCNSPVNEN